MKLYTVNSFVLIYPFVYSLLNMRHVYNFSTMDFRLRRFRKFLLGPNLAPEGLIIGSLPESSELPPVIRP